MLRVLIAKERCDLDIERDSLLWIFMRLYRFGQYNYYAVAAALI